MSAPLIGITTRIAPSPVYSIPLVASPKSYSQALIEAGAIPLLIPLNLPKAMFADLLKRVDGIIFTGGGDIETACYSGIEHERVNNVDPDRDAYEIQLARDVVEIKKPFLGVCRGLQIMNVAYGGTLYSHIPDQLEGAIKHTFFPGYSWDHMTHQVQISEGSLLGEITGQPVLEVNSLHHQGIKELAENLKPVATSPDGLVEALELRDHPFGLAVQWHPEWLTAKVEMRAIFSALVDAARNGSV